MSAMDERSVEEIIFNPWAVYIAGVGDDQPDNPSFYTSRGIGINPMLEFVEATAYNVCNGIDYVIRKDIKSFKLVCTWEIKNFSLNIFQFVYGGEIDSDGSTLTLNGAAPPLKACWLETCFNDNSKVIRLTIPRGRSVESATFSAGDAHILVPTTFEAIPDISDDSYLPTLYIEP